MSKAVLLLKEIMTDTYKSRSNFSKELYPKLEELMKIVNYNEMINGIYKTPTIAGKDKDV